MESFVIVEQANNYNKIRHYIDQILRTPKVKNPAVIFDIDATLLFNDETELGGECRARKNVPILNIHRQCIQRKIPVFLVTARPLTGRQFTEEQLKCLGITYNFLFLRPPSYRSWGDISMFKQHCRDMIRNSGYNTLLNVGDQWSDVVQATSKQLSMLGTWSSESYILLAPVQESTDWALKLPIEKG